MSAAETETPHEPIRTDAASHVGRHTEVRIARQLYMDARKAFKQMYPDAAVTSFNHQAMRELSQPYKTFFTWYKSDKLEEESTRFQYMVYQASPSSYWTSQRSQRLVLMADTACWLMRQDDRGEVTSEKNSLIEEYVSKLENSGVQATAAEWFSRGCRNIDNYFKLGILGTMALTLDPESTAVVFLHELDCQMSDQASVLDCMLPFERE